MDSKSPIQAAIQAHMDKTGESARSLSLRAGLHEKVVSQILRGKMQSSRGVTLAKLADALGLNINDLVRSAASTPRTDAAVLPPVGRLTVREYDVGASAGHGLEPPVLNGDGETPVLAEWTLPEDLVRGHTTPGRHLALIRVEGNSMEPEYHPGDRVLVDLSRRKPSPPGEFVIWDGMGLVLKRVELVPNTEPRRIRLLSINPGYTPYEVVLDEHTIVARVIGKWQWR